VKDIRRATRRHFSAEEKIRVVLEGLRGEDSIACQRALNFPRLWAFKFPWLPGFGCVGDQPLW
jgi:hypothetical protein